MTTLLKYKYICSNGDTILGEWREIDQGEPTHCSLDSSHTIVGSSLQVVDRADPNESKIIEENIPTGGNYAKDAIVFTVPASETGYVYEDAGWEEDINVISISYVTKDEHEGDSFKVLVGEDTLAGQSGTEVASGTNSITLSVLAHVENFVIGYYAKITDGVNTDDLGVITNVDKVNGVVTCKNNTTNTFAAGSALLLTRIMVGRKSPLEIGPAWNNTAGKDKIGASYLPAGTKIKFIYNNMSAVSKKLVFNVYYMY